MMEVGELISFYRRQCGMTIDELAEKSGVAKGTLNKIMGGVTKAPTLDNMKAIARALGKRLADFDDEPELADMFSPSEQAHIQKYRLLDPYGKEAVESILDIEHRRCGDVQPETEAPQEPQKVIKMPKPRKQGRMVEIRVYDEPAAAGLGNYLDNPDYHIEQYPEHILPSGTDFGIRIDGDSMEPKIHDGYTVFVAARPMIDPGQIGIFVLNGKSYCKKLIVDHEKRQTRLQSLNSKYEDIVIGEDDYLKTLGHVLGQWGAESKEDDFLDW